jgi:hypothetical protein
VEANVKKAFIAATAIPAYATGAHADELSDIQAQAKQLHEQNAAMAGIGADVFIANGAYPSHEH